MAGFILNHKNAPNIPITTPKIVVVKYHHSKKEATASINKIININHQAKPSNQSVILTALTIATVKIKVKIK